MWLLTLPTEIRRYKHSSQTELLPSTRDLAQVIGSTWIWAPTRRMKRRRACRLKSCVAAKGGFLGTKAPFNCHLDKVFRKIHSDHVENSCSRQAVVCFSFERLIIHSAPPLHNSCSLSATQVHTIFGNDLRYPLR